MNSDSVNFRGARLLDPATGRDETSDLFVADGVISDTPAKGAREINARGCVIMPAAVDLHVHFREPGGETAETVATGLEAAFKGGFGTVVTMPNTTPPVDSPESVLMQKKLAAESHSKVWLLPSACCTVGRAGQEVAPLESLAKAGTVAFSDDGNMVASDEVMEEVMSRAAALGFPVMDHAVIPELQGVVRECALARSSGLKTFPDEAETRAVARDIELAASTKAHIHLQHLSDGESAELVRKARAANVAISAEATPHHLALDCDMIRSDDANWKMNPPLGRPSDRMALRAAVLDGTIDCFATDHAPHPSSAKAKGFASAPFGIIGLETALASTWKSMVLEEGMSPLQWCCCWTKNPARVISIPCPALAVGSSARITLLRPEAWVVRKESFASKSSNSPFIGATMPIKPETFIFG